MSQAASETGSPPCRLQPGHSLPGQASDSPRHPPPARHGHTEPPPACGPPAASAMPGRRGLTARPEPPQEAPHSHALLREVWLGGGRLQRAQAVLPQCLLLALHTSSLVPDNSLAIVQGPGGKIHTVVRVPWESLSFTAVQPSCPNYPVQSGCPRLHGHSITGKAVCHPTALTNPITTCWLLPSSIATPPAPQVCTHPHRLSTLSSGTQQPPESCTGQADTGSAWTRRRTSKTGPGGLVAATQSEGVTVVTTVCGHMRGMRWMRPPAAETQ